MTHVVKVLLEHESVVELSDSNDNPPTPLLMACVGNRETVQLLLNRGHDPNLLDVSVGMRPLHVASFAGNIQIVHTLLEAGCDKEAPDQDGIKAWTLATLAGHVRIARLLEEFADKKLGQAVSPARLLQSTEHRNAGSATSNHSGDQSELPIRAMTRYAVCRPQSGRTLVRHLLSDVIRPFLVDGSLRVIENFASGGLNMGSCFKGCTCTPMLVAVAHDHIKIVTYLVSIGVPLLTEDKYLLIAPWR
jgi:hypothetical protein